MNINCTLKTSFKLILLINFKTFYLLPNRHYFLLTNPFFFGMNPVRLVPIVVLLLEMCGRTMAPEESLVTCWLHETDAGRAGDGNWRVLFAETTLLWDVPLRDELGSTNSTSKFSFSVSSPLFLIRIFSISLMQSSLTILIISMFGLFCK